MSQDFLPNSNISMTRICMSLRGDLFTNKRWIMNILWRSNQGRAICPSLLWKEWINIERMKKKCSLPRFELQTSQARKNVLMSWCSELFGYLPPPPYLYFFSFLLFDLLVLLWNLLARVFFLRNSTIFLFISPKKLL